MANAQRFLVSVDGTADRIYRHSEITEVIVDSFSSPSSDPWGVAITKNGNLVSSDLTARRIYVHSGIGGAVATSFPTPIESGTSQFVRGIALDGSDNLILASESAIYVNSGVSNTFSSSFTYFPPNLVIEAQDITVSASFHLVSSTLGFVSNQIYVHSGISNVITASFYPPEPFTLSGVAIDNEFGNLISTKYGDPARIFLHSGVTDVVQISFPTPGTGPRGLAYTFPFYSYIKGGTTVSVPGDRDYVKSRTSIAEDAPPAGAGWMLVYKSRTDLGDYGVVTYAGISTTVVTSFPLLFSGNTPSGMTIDTLGNLVTADASADKIRIHVGISASISFSFASPATQSKGLAVDTVTGGLISTDSLADRIYVHSGVTSTITNSFASPSGYPADVAVTSLGDLVSLDSSLSGQGVSGIYQHSGITGSATWLFGLGADKTGIALDGSGNLLVASESESRIRRHSGVSSIVLQTLYFGEYSYPAHVEFSLFSPYYLYTSVKAACNVITVPVASFIKGAARAAALTSLIGNRITSVVNGNIYIHSGLTNTVTSSWTDVNSGGGVTVDSSGNLVTKQTAKIYIHSGLTATITSSFPAPWALQNDFDTLGMQDGNLVSCNNTTIYIHSGVGSTVSSSYTAPGPPCVGIAWNAFDNQLLSWEQDTAKIYRHSGTTSTIVSSFVISGISTTSSQGGGIAVDEATGDLIVYLNLETMARRQVGISGTWRADIGIPTASIRLNDCAVSLVGGELLPFNAIEHMKGRAALSASVDIQSVKSAASLAVQEHVKGACLLQVEVAAFTAGACRLLVESSAFIRGAVAVRGPYLISCDSTANLIYVHVGVTQSIAESFPAPSTSPQGVAYTQEKNLVSSDIAVDKIYVHSSVSATITLSFSSPTGVRGIAMDSSGRLISATPQTVYIHSAISATILSSFAYFPPDPSAQARDVAFDRVYGRLISSNTLTKIFVHAGVTNTIVDSFAAPAGFTTGVTLDEDGNLVVDSLTTDTVYVYSGITSVIQRSFSTPGSSPQGLAHSAFAMALGERGYILSRTRIEPTYLVTRQYISAISAFRIVLYPGLTALGSFDIVPPASGVSGVAVDRETGRILSSDYWSRRVYMHRGMTSVITSSFVVPDNTTPTGLAVDGTGNLLVAVETQRVYVFQGVSGAFSRSFSLSTVSLNSIDDLSVASSGDLVSAVDLWQGAGKIYVHSGITGTVTASFSGPGTFVAGIAVDEFGNLVSTGNENIFVHSGITGTIRWSFQLVDPASVSVYDLDLAPITALYDVREYIKGAAALRAIPAAATGSLIMADGNYIVVGDGISSIVIDSFSRPGPDGSVSDVALAPGMNLVAGVRRVSTNTIYVCGGISNTVTSSFPAVTDIWGLTVDPGGNLISAQSADSGVTSLTVYGHAGLTGVINSSFAKTIRPDYDYALLGAGTLRVFEGTGIDSTFARVYGLPISCDSVANKIYVHALDFSFTVISSFAFAGTSPTGAACTSLGDLLVCDSATRRVYRYDGVTQSVIGTFDLPASATSPAGLAVSQAGNLVSCSQDTRLIYLHSGLTGMVTTSFPAPSTSVGEGTPTALGVFDGSLVSAVITPSGSGYREKISIHAGVSQVVISSFDNYVGTGYVSGLDVERGNLIISRVTSPPTIKACVGLDPFNVDFSANSPGTSPSGIAMQRNSGYIFDIGGLCLNRGADLVMAGVYSGKIQQYYGRTNLIRRADQFSLTVSPYGVAVSSEGNLLVSAGGSIYVRSGTDGPVTDSFTAPVSAGIALSLLVGLDHVKGATTVGVEALDAVKGKARLAVRISIKGAASLAIQESVKGNAFLVVISSIGGAASLAIQESVKGAASFAIQESVKGSASLSVQEHLKGVASLTLPPVTGILISCDATSKRIYVHSGLSGTVTSSFLFAGTTPNGLAVVGRDLLASDVSGNKVYRYVGVTSTVSSSFALPYAAPAGLGVDSSGNLVSCSGSAKLIYVHSGVSGTITSSFPAPDTSGGGASPTGIGVTNAGTLTSVVVSGHFWGNQSKVAVHSGVSQTVVSSFENAWQGTSLLITGAEVDELGNLYTCDITSLKIRQHVGLTATVYSLFSSPGLEPSGLGIQDPLGELSSVKGAASLVYGGDEYLLSRTTILSLVLEHVRGAAWLIAGGEREHLKGAALVQPDLRGYVKSLTWLSLPGTRDYVLGKAKVQEGFPLFEATDYCRDARDFQGMLGSYASGQGYGYDATNGNWADPALHGGDYTSAQHLAAKGATANVETTVFSDTYVNREGFPPADRITGFKAGNYYVWIQVNGATGALAHGVTVGSNPEIQVASGESGAWAWRQVGTSAYSVDSTTQFQFRFTNADSFLHAIRGVYLKPSPGIPDHNPSIAGVANLLSSDRDVARVYVHSVDTGAVSTSFSVPMDPMGLTMDLSGNLVVCATGNDIYTMLGISGTQTGNFALSADPTDITITSSGNLLVADYIEDKVRVYSGISATQVTSFPLPFTNPYGLSTDLSGNLLSSDTTARRIYVHSGISSTISVSFASPSIEPRGLALDDLGNLLSADSDARRIYKHSGISPTVTGIFGSPAAQPRGLTVGAALQYGASGDCTTNYFLYLSFVKSATSLVAVGQDHVKSAASVILTTFTVIEHIKGAANAVFAPFTDNFSIKERVSFYFSDVFNVLFTGFSGTLQDIFTIKETPGIFRDLFSVVSVASQQSQDSDVQIIVVEVI